MTPSYSQRILSKIHRLLDKAYQLGGRFRCSVCKRDVRCFAPLAESFFRNWSKHGFDLPLDRLEMINLHQYSCPWCGVSDRDRLFVLYFEEIAKDIQHRPSCRFIEFAPIGALTRNLRLLFGQNVDYRTADFMMPGVDDFVDLCDMRATYRDNSVDAFLCSHVLEHVPDDRQAFRELFRILRPGGWGVLLAPIHLDLNESREGGGLMSEEDRWKHFGQDDHLRLYSKADFESRIREAGFTLEIIGPEFFSSATLQRHGLLAHSTLYVARK